MESIMAPRADTARVHGEYSDLRFGFNRSEISMQLDEVEPRVLGIVLRNAVVPAESRADLRELNGGELVHQAPARFLAVRHRAVWIEKLVGELEIIAAGDEPVRLEQGGELLTLRIDDAVRVGHLGLRQPGDGTGPKSAENAVGTLAAGGLVVIVGGNPQPPDRLHVRHIEAGFFAVALDGAAGGAVAERELRIPGAALPSEFHSLIGRGHVDSGGGEYEGSLVLKPQPEGQVHLPGFEIPVVRRGPVQNIGFAIERASRSDLLIDVRQKPVGNDIRFQVDAGLLEREFLHRGGLRHLRPLGVEPQIAAGPQIRTQLTGPIVEFRVEVLIGNDGLRQYVGKRRAQAAAGRIDVALAAFEAELHREIGLGLRRIGAEAQPEGQAVPAETSVPADHGAGTTVNTKEMSDPKVRALRSASAPPPVPRKVTR